MAIVGSDFHGNLKKCKVFLEYKPEELHIFAGDAVDSYTKSPEEQLKVLELLVESENTILLYGNHELSYHRKHQISCSGRHYVGMQTFPELVENKKWKIAHVVDDYLITHAGVSAKHAAGYKKIDNLAKRLNKDLVRKSNGIFDVGYCRGGFKFSGGPLWYDFRYDYDGLAKQFNQVFGHCSLNEPWEDKGENYHHVCVNSHDTLNDLWIFDTTTKSIEIIKG